jgi:2-polyprenyl-3-methyl-5-hydroxy-6-metoxy-1,4-benzoquinol methylase
MRKSLTRWATTGLEAGADGAAIGEIDRPRLPPEGNDWDHRRLKAEMCLVPWIERHFPLAERSVFEYGCGSGPVSCAIAARARRHIGIDIDRDQVELGRRQLSARHLENVELVHAAVDEIFDETSRLAAGADVFLFYAVLEHMTISERLNVLELARQVVHPQGIIVVCELPNRLIPYDGHTSQLPFFAQLPDELAIDYYRFSQREDFVSAMDAACARGRDDARESLARWGRGMSFHEFELVFGDLRGHVVASNYDELLMPVRAVSGEELVLAHLLEQYRPDLAPVWSRYWQDVILSATPLNTVPQFIRPLLLDLATGDSIAFLSSGVVEMSTGAVMRLSLPAPSQRILLGVITDSEKVTVEMVTPGGTASATVPAWRSLTDTRYTTIEIPSPSSELEVRLGGPGYVTFVGYAA